MIAAKEARLAAVVTQRGGPAEPWRARNLHRFAPYYARQVRNLGMRLAYRRPPGGAGPTERVDPARARALAQLCPRLDPATVHSGVLYRPGGLADLMVRAQRPGVGEWPLVGRIVTMELVSRRGTDSGRPPHRRSAPGTL